MAETLLQGEAEALTRLAIERAKAGDTAALRMCLDRLAPPSKHRTIEFELRPLRTSEEFAELAFTGLDLVEPGVVLVSDWRPETDRMRPLASEVNTYGGVARKP